ncbi:hypothetical protein U1Q18_019762 [Sarracenia purpurea var. burkii]
MRVELDGISVNEAELCEIFAHVQLIIRVFKYSVEEVDLRSETSVDAEWMAYLGAFHCLCSLNIADCSRITNSALWAITVLLDKTTYIYTSQAHMYGENEIENLVLGLLWEMKNEELIDGFSGMTNLKEVDLARCSKVSDTGIRHLLSVSSLEKLNISETGVTAEGISLLSSLTNLSVLDLGGLIHQAGNEPDWIPSLTPLQNLIHLESLDLEESRVRDAALHPLSGFQQLTYLSLKSDFLTDVSLYLLSSLPKLTNLSVRDAVLTNAGLDSFNPPATLKMLDLRGCWLLTEDALLLFRKKHPLIEVRHELVHIVQSDRYSPNTSSPSQATFKGLQSKQKWGKMPVSPFRSNNNAFLDQRLKYSREELLVMQFSSLSHVSSTPRGRGNV